MGWNRYEVCLRPVCWMPPLQSWHHSAVEDPVLAHPVGRLGKVCSLPHPDQDIVDPGLHFVVHIVAIVGPAYYIVVLADCIVDSAHRSYDPASSIVDTCSRIVEPHYHIGHTLVLAGPESHIVDIVVGPRMVGLAHFGNRIVVLADFGPRTVVLADFGPRTAVLADRGPHIAVFADPGKIVQLLYTHCQSYIVVLACILRAALEDIAYLVGRIDLVHTVNSPWLVGYLV